MDQIDGRRVAKRRADLGIRSQGELAKRVRDAGGHLKQTQISKIENSWPGRELPKGQKPVKISRSLRHLAIALQTSQEFLLGLTEDELPPVESRLKNEHHSIGTGSFPDSDGVLLSLWEVSPQIGSAGPGGELFLQETDETTPANPRFRGKKKAFCVAAWDNSNEPHAPVNTKLFVNGRERGIKGRWCLLCKSADLDAGRIIGPAFGVLIGENGNSWTVVQGIRTVVFSMAEWPITFLIEQIIS